MTTIWKTSIIASLCIVVATVSAVGQDKGDRTPEQITCKDILREPGFDRDIAIAFIHGYLVAKSNAKTFNIATLSQQTDAFLDRCIDNPTAKALEVMTKVQAP